MERPNERGILLIVIIVSQGLQFDEERYLLLGYVCPCLDTKLNIERFGVFWGGWGVGGGCVCMCV